MANSSAFDWVCEQLEERTTLDRLEARGTVRLALKEAGLDASSVSPEQMRVVIEKILPGELEVRGIEEPGAHCSALAEGVAAIEADTPIETPDAVFARLAGGSVTA